MIFERGPRVFRETHPQVYVSRRYGWLWLILTFQAGFANAGGFLATSRFVSHMTGFGTRVGIALSQKDYGFALEMFSAPVAFVLGGAASGLAIDRRLLLGKSPRYLVVTFIIFILFLLVTIGGIIGEFGAFGKVISLERDFEIVSLLCFGCGMQNAAFSTLSRAQVRTTHMTGLLTDTGIGMIRVFFIPPEERKAQGKLNAFRVGLFISFSLGSALSAIEFTRVGFDGFRWLSISSFFVFLILAAERLLRFFRLGRLRKQRTR